MTDLRRRAQTFLETRDPAAALPLLRAAAEAGDADAALTEVAFLGNGSGGSPNWPSALCRLREAAKRHGGEAAEHLALLETMRLDANGDPLSLPAPDILSASPDVRIWRGFLSPGECAHIATSVLDLLAPSQVIDPASGRFIEHPVRTSSAALIGPTRESLPVQAILKRVAAATGTQVAQGEALTVLHYAPGQQYRLHHDALPHTVNQRIGTMLLYLNEGYVGGETRFEAADLTVAGRGGDALWFANTSADGTPDPAARHAGLPVRQGAKWLATRWVRARPFDVWRGPESV